MYLITPIAIKALKSKPSNAQYRIDSNRNKKVFQ